MIQWQLVIFDCDGVLVDSEPIVNRIFAELLTEIGLPMTYEETVQTFVGKSTADCLKIVERSLGKPVPTDLLERSKEREIAALERELKPIAGIASVLERLTVPKCVASNSSPRHIHHVLQLTGLFHHFDGKFFSAAQVERAKPFPDVYLHAAQQMGADPQTCVVIEDSVPGVQAGSAAGMTVLGYAERSDRHALATAGAKAVFEDMGQLLELLTAEVKN
jgi:HAD superfamily hydrolase (TIGR01509 family)